MVRGRAVLCVAVALAGCAPAAAPKAPVRAPPTQAEWAYARKLLAGIQPQARTERISLALREPHTGRVLSARGAVAVLPPRSLRMILLGPGGTTALDLWIDGDRYRFAVPALDLVKRGDLRAPREERRGLPVDFLAFWLLHPARGRLLWYGAWSGGDQEGGDHLVLRDGEAIVDLYTVGGGLAARRTTWSSADSGHAKLIDEEHVKATGLGCAEVRYHQRSTGLDVEVRCEDVTPGPPPARALVDPDAEGAP